MKVTKIINREKLYKREYDRDNILRIDEGSFEPQIFDGLARIVSLMIKGGSCNG